MRGRTGVAVLAALLVAGTAAAAYAEIAVSANDAKVKLVNGKQEVQKSPLPDTVTFIDLRATPPKVLAEIEVPNSVTGPPTNVAVSPKEDIALVASSMMIDPADPTKLIPDDRLTVIDLSPLKPSLVTRLRTAVGAAPKGGSPVPKVLATLQAGKGAAGVSINKAGTLALVANSAEGTVSVFTIAGTTVTPAGKVTVGKPDSGPSHVVFTPDGKRALVTRDRRPSHRRAVGGRQQGGADRARDHVGLASQRHRRRLHGRRGGGGQHRDFRQRRHQHAEPHRPQARSAARGQQRVRRRDAGRHEDLARRQVRRRHRHERLQSGAGLRRSTTTTACCRCGPATARS